MAKPAYLSVRNYEKYQHYTNRNPPWVKIYWGLLSDDKFVMLSLADRGLYCLMILLASRHDNYIPFDPIYIQLQLKLTEQPDLSRLIHSGFLLARCKQSASKMLAERKHGASKMLDKLAPSLLSPQTPLSSLTLSSLNPNLNLNLKIKEQGLDQGLNNFGALDEVFDEFWEAYPKRHGKKIGKAKARMLFNQLVPNDQKLCILAARNYGASSRAQEGFVRDAERFLKADYWREWIEPETPQVIALKPQRFSPTAAAMAKVRELEALQRG